MLNYFIRRLYLLCITAFILSLIVFLIKHWTLPTQITSNSLSHYIDFMTDLLKGEWGYSIVNNESIFHAGLIAFASTLELCLFALITSSCIAIPLGILAGLNRNNGIDYFIMGIALVGLAIPVFWVSIIMMMLPNILGISFPIDGNLSPIYEVPIVSGFMIVDTLFVTDQYQFDAFYNHLAHLVLPSMVLSIFLITEIIRLTRHAITMVMKTNYVKAAHAKGLTTRKIIFRHVLKNALPSVLHQLRFQMSTIISFAMTVEIVFSLPGSGVWLLTSIQNADYLALSSSILIISGFILLASIIIDIFLVIISPIKRKSLYADQ